MTITKKNNPKQKRETVTGTKLRGDRIWEEYLGVLKYRTSRYDIYDRMTRSDYQVARMMRTINSPILSGNYDYKPIDPKDAEQVKQALYKNKFYNEYGVDQWENTCYQILSYLKHGFAIFEPYGYRVIDQELGSVLMMKSIGFIRQSTIDGWKISKGEIKAIKQVSSENILQDGTVNKWISGKNLYCITNQKEGDNYEGISLLRAIYGNYVRKDLYLRLDMIGVEKMAVGTPIAFLPDSMLKDDGDTTDRDNIISMLENYIASESNYMILPKSLQGHKDEHPGFYIQEGKYDSKAVQAAIQREDTKIMDAVLASFLDIGIYKAGGNSQNEGQMEMFLNSLLAVARMIKRLRDDIAHRFYVANFGTPKVRIDTTVSNIARNDAAQAMEILRGYAQVDMIRPDERLEKELRSDLGLPEKEMSTERKIVADPDKNTQRTPEGEEKPQKSPEKVKKDE